MLWSGPPFRIPLWGDSEKQLAKQTAPSGQAAATSVGLALFCLMKQRRFQNFDLVRWTQTLQP